MRLEFLILEFFQTVQQKAWGTTNRSGVLTRIIIFEAEIAEYVLVSISEAQANSSVLNQSNHFFATHITGDFGLARGGPESDAYSYKTVSSVQGTAAYLPLDYVRSRHLTPAVDTFCYGIFLFELVSGKSPSWTDPKTNTTIR